MKKLFSTLLIAIVAIAASAAGKVPRAYGIRLDYENPARTALVSFSVDAPDRFTEELNLSQYGSIRAGVCDGSTYYLVTTTDGLMPDKFVALDFDSHRATVVKEYDWKLDYTGSIVVFDMALNPADGTMYAVGFSMEDAEVTDEEIDAPIALYSVDAATGEFTEIGKQNKVAIYAIAFNADGDLLGISSNGDLWVINEHRGTPADNLYSTGIEPNGNQSLAFDPEGGALYWTAHTLSNLNEGAGSLVRITGMEDWMFDHAEMGALDGNSEVVGLYIDPDPVANTAPEAPADVVAVADAEGANAVRVSWTNPVRNRGGEPLERVDINIYADDVLVKSIAGLLPGEKSSYTHVIPAPAMVGMSIGASAAGEEGNRAFAEPVFVGADVPAAPGAATARRVSPDTYDIDISWTAPTTGAHGGWIDTRTLAYHVERVNDGKVIAESTTATTLVDADITAPGGYTYRITPLTINGNGVPAETNPCLSGGALTPPYSMDLSTPSGINLWTIVNGDNDEYAWKIAENWGGTMEKFFRYYPVELVGSSTAADEWLISPAVSLEQGKYYALRYQVRMWGDLFPTDYEVMMGNGNNASAMTTALQSYTDVTTDLEWEPRAAAFRADRTGDFNFGFHATRSNPIDIYKVEIKEIAKTDLAATSVTGNTAGGVDVPATYTVTVFNEGFDDIDTYAVSLVDADGTNLATATVKTPLASQTEATVEIEWIPATSGKIAVSAKVTAPGDENSANDLSAPVNVTVLPSGSWQHITHGRTMTGYAPFYMQYLHSGAQTIYHADELGAEPCKIEGLMYYYSIMNGRASAPVQIKIALANTDAYDFDHSSTLESEDFTTVLETVIYFDPARKSITLMFDRPFEYTGGNLCVQTQHSTTEIASVIYNGSRNDTGAAYTALYRSDDTPYYFNHNAGAFNDRPNVSLYMSGRSGVEDVTVDAPAIGYDRGARTVRLDRAATVCVYSLQGTLLLRSDDATAVDVSALRGPAVITAGAATLKVVF